MVKTLEENNVQTPAHFVQKPKSWFKRLSTGGLNAEEGSNNLLFNGTDRYAIEKFREWYSYRFVGYLPSDWIVTFRNDNVHPKERDLRKVLSVIGLNADAVRALKMNDIRSITNLNRTSKDWMTGSKGGFDSLRGSLTSNLRSRVLEQEKRSKEWKQMGLTRNDASDVICFRHWYNFYVSGKKNMNGWVAEFSSAHYRNFIQLYEPGDYFKHPGVLTARKDKLRLSQEKQDYYAILQKATKAGDMSKEQRYHLLQYMERREKMSIIDDIESQRDEGNHKRIG